MTVYLKYVFTGIIFNPDTYKQTRKFAVTAMRDFGLGKQSLEDRIQNEALALVEQFRSHDGKPFNPHQNINLAVANIICSIMFGSRWRMQWYGENKIKWTDLQSTVIWLRILVGILNLAGSRLLTEPLAENSSSYFTVLEKISDDRENSDEKKNTLITTPLKNRQICIKIGPIDSVYMPV